MSQVPYNPITIAPASDLSTIYSCVTLVSSSKCAGSEESALCFDMGLLTKALEIKWSNPRELEGVILKEGEMNSLMHATAGVGYLYGDVGLSNLLH